MSTSIATTSSPAPDEDQQQLIELDRQRQQLRQRLISLRGQLNSKTKQTRKNELCIEEIKGLDNTTNIYKAVGRAFFLNSMDGMRTELTEKVTRTKDEIQSLTAMEKKLTEELEGAEKALEELVDKQEKS